MQALKLRELISQYNISFDLCYTSPLSRAKETAKIISNGTEIKIEQALIEIDAGSASHLPLSELNNLEPRFQRHGLVPDLKYPNGESLLEFQERILKWFENEFAKAEKGKSYLLVAHWGTLNIILHHLFKIPLDNYCAFYLNNCELTYITMLDGNLAYPQIHKVNTI